MSEAWGPFQLLEKLGAGGMAEVWRARRKGEARELVVKRMQASLRDDAEFAALFAREGRVATGLHHPNIVEVFEAGEVRGEPFLSMECVEGVDLRELLSSAGVALSPGVAGLVVRDLGRALACVHAAGGAGAEALGLVHRDVTPSNVLLRLDGAVKLSDFGIARAARDTRRTRTGSFRGKLTYAAPEVLEGAPHDARADLYSLGVVFYELLTGVRLFDADTDVQVFGKVLAAHVPPVSDLRPEVSPALEAVCLTLLARLPGDRYQTAEELLLALEPALKGEGEARDELAGLVRQARARRPEKRVVAAPSPLLPRLAVLGVVVSLVVALVVAGRALSPPQLAAPLDAGVVSSGSPLDEVVADAGVVISGAPLDEVAADAGLVVSAAPLDAGVVIRPPVELSTRPSGAVVKSVQGKVLGSTPWTRHGGAPARVVVELRGYRSQVVEVPGAGALSVTLQPLPRAPRTPPKGLRDGGMLDPF